MKTGEVNLLEKLPQTNEAKSAEKRLAAAKMITFAVTAFSFLTCVSVNFLMNNIQQHDWAAGIVYTCFGLIVGLPVVSVAFAVLTTFDLHVRLIGLCTSVALSLFAIMAGVEQPFFSDILGMLTLLPIILLGCAIPFLFVKHLLHWQIIFEPLFQQPKRRPISVAGMLIFTAVIAVCIASVQMYEIPSAGLIAMLAVAGIGFAFVLPLLRVQLLSRRYWVGLLSTYFGTFLVVATALQSVSKLSPLKLAVDSEAIGFGHSAATGVLVMGLFVVACRMAGGRLAFGVVKEGTV